MAHKAPEDPFPVATHVHRCLVGFQEVSESLTQAEPYVRTKISPWVINDELGRFRLWCGNVGAHRRGRGSLDYKLREASHIRDQVIELLQSLVSVLGEANEITTGERISGEDLSDSDSDSDHDREEQTTTELEKLVSNLAEINTCLMRLSMAIRNPAPHDQFMRSSHTDVSHFEPFDIDHVRGKFPMAKEYLIVRLGKAISRRRHYLRYREEHRKKLEHGLQPDIKLEVVDAPQLVPYTKAVASEKIESTVASSLPLVLKASTSTVELDGNEYYDEALSQTSFASSANDLTKLRPPPLPKPGENGDPVECPLCFRFTSVRQLSAWHKHVYRDLQPYVCTSEDCEVSDRTYESRHDWFHHEVQAHRKWWECINECNRSFEAIDQFRAHISLEHEDLASGERINDFMRSCERHCSMATNAKCPLCRLEIASLTSLRRHLGKHLEELSLFALPSHLREGPNENSDEEDADDSHSLSRIAQECKSQTTSTDANRDREQSSQEYDDFAAACHRWSLRLNEEDSQWKDSIYGVPLQQAVQGDLDPTPGPNMTATHGESALENVVGKSDDFVPNTRNSNTSDKDAPSTDTPITTGGQIENDDRITVPTRQEDPVSSIGVSGLSTNFGTIPAINVSSPRVHGIAQTSATSISPPEIRPSNGFAEQGGHTLYSDQHSDHLVCQCVFWPLGCDEAFAVEADWKAHGLTHFHGFPVPDAAYCAACDTRVNNTSPPFFDAWATKLDHIITLHSSGSGFDVRAFCDDELFSQLYAYNFLSGRETEQLLNGERIVARCLTNADYFADEEVDAQPRDT